MSALFAAARRHPLYAYFVMTFAISWGAVLIVVGPSHIPGRAEELRTLFPFVLLAMLAGPSLAGTALTAIVHGTWGFRELASHLRVRGISAGWYAVALLTAPVIMCGVLLTLSFVTSGWQPAIVTVADKRTLLASGLAVALAVGFFEELGWAGFAVRELRRRHGILSTGLAVGIPWAAWHLLTNVAWSGETSMGSLEPAVFFPSSVLAVLVGYLPPYRILMVWVQDHTGSVLLPMLMHGSLTASVLTLSPAALTGFPLLLLSFAVAAGFWMVVASMFLLSRPHASIHAPLQRVM
jgi:membrane protease YdiL (CAAX protease family)